MLIVALALNRQPGCSIQRLRQIGVCVFVCICVWGSVGLIKHSQLFSSSSSALAELGQARHTCLSEHFQIHSTTI